MTQRRIARCVGHDGRELAVPYIAMEKALKQRFVACCKLIILAQIASDSGKDCYQDQCNNSGKATQKGYRIKNDYIWYAVKAAALCPSLVRVSQKDTIIYFDIKGYGQVSFHTFTVWPNVPHTGVWTGYIGSSSLVCATMSRKLNLGLYK